MKRIAQFIVGLPTVFLCLSLSGGDQTEQTNVPQLAPIPRSQSPKIMPDFGKIPLQFIPNKGQISGPAAFYIQGVDKSVYFAAGGLTFVLNGLQKSPPERWAIKLDFVGANPIVSPLGLEESGAFISYFKGKSEDWKAGLRACSKIIYRELWPGIDLVYSGTVSRMKYEFVVHPGADPSVIKLAYRGAESVVLTEEGRLAVATPAGGLEDDVPVAWQDIGGCRSNIPAAFFLEAFETSQGSTKHIFGFKLGDYDKNLPLVLDPAIFVYCGYIGGAGWDRCSAIAVDGLGNAYVAGDTSSTEDTFPLAVGPDLTYNGEPEDAFVAKVNAAGTGLVYCSYIGGNGFEEGYGIAVDDSGNAYITGVTSSTDFPVTAGSALFSTGGQDAWVAKVSADGTELVYSGCIGGWAEDTGSGIAVDGSGNAYVTGWTNSSDLPVKVGPDMTFNGSEDAFVAKVNAAGTDLVYCGYIGGWAYDNGRAIAVDSSGNAYVTGRTASADDFPVKIGPDLKQNGWFDVFVAKVNAAGTDLVYCGYIGGIYDEDGYGIAVDSSGNAYITGYTDSGLAGFPLKTGPDLTWNGGSSDAFIAKVNAQGTDLVYCGYIGGGPSAIGYGNDRGYGIAVDSSGSAYVTGGTDSAETTFPVTVGPDLTYNGLGEAFVAKVKADGKGLLYCGYIGGEADEYGCAIALDGSGDAYVAGQTNSTEATFPVTTGPDLTFNGTGDYDGFVAKVSMSTAGFTIGRSPTTATVPAGQSATFMIQIAPRNSSFDSAVSFTCTGLPGGCAASFSPPSVTPGANPVSTTLTLNTTALAAISTGGIMAGSRSIPSAMWLSGLALVVVGCLIAKRLIPVRVSYRWLAAAFLVCAVGIIASCGAGGDNNPPSNRGTPPGTYRIVVNGTAGSSAVSTTVTLVVR